MLTQLGILMLALAAGFLLRLFAAGISRLIPRIGRAGTVVLDCLLSLCLGAAVLAVMFALNDGMFVPFTSMFFFLGVSFPSLFMKNNR